MKKANTEKKIERPKKQRKIARSFLQWLLFLVVIAFLATTVFLWIFQTELAKSNSDHLLRLNITDVQADIRDATDEDLLEIVHSVSAELDAVHADTANPEELNNRIDTMLKRYNVAEINIVNSKGIIVASNFKGFLGYDMESGEQSSAFMVLLRGEKEFAQGYQPIAYDASMERKYAGCVLRNGGFVQVGYDFDQFQKSIDKEVIALTRNRHVGSGGRILICDKEGNIVSNAKEIDRETLDLEGIGAKSGSLQLGERFHAEVDGEAFYCMAEESEGYYIIALMPEREVILTRNLVVIIAAAAEVFVFGALAFVIFLLIKKQIVNSVVRINGSLSQITGGNLDVTVDVRNNVEFNSLSNDINATVDSLKKYIAQAESRIDAELAFAKDIQHSALPSVFPPYPNRHEIEIHATMHTAKEVGGDFYDFYFLGEDNFAFLIADVSGKGIPAALFMMESKTIIKSLAESGLSVEQIFTYANQKLCEGNDAGMFVTAWMGILNVRTGKVVYANAGHNPPLIKHADGTLEYLKSRAGFVLAGMEEICYKKNELQLEPGDVIYLYTDGVTEATNANNALYGEDRLHAILEKHKNAATHTICDEVKRDVDLFVGDAPQFDDITMLALKYNGPEVRE